MLLFESFFSIEVLLDFFLLIDLKPLVDDFVDFFRFCDIDKSGTKICLVTMIYYSQENTY